MVQGLKGRVRTPVSVFSGWWVLEGEATWGEAPEGDFRVTWDTRGGGLQGEHTEAENKNWK